MSSFFGGNENYKHKITINLVDIDHIRYNFHVLLICFFNGHMELLIHCLFFIGIRELKLRQIEVNIIFGWSRQNSDEMAIS